MPERPRRRSVMLGAALLVALAGAVAVYAGRSGGGGEAVRLVPPEQRQAMAAAPTQAPAPTEAPAPAPPNAAGLRLHGVTATGAIIGFENGVQRLILLGRPVLRGLTLQQVHHHHVLLAASDGVIELGFGGPPRSPQAGDEAQPSVARRTPEAEARREEILQYRFGLAPRRSGDRITGYEIRPRASLPVLARAGLLPGDVLISVNGQSFDSQEKVQELAGEIAGSFTAEFEFERGGRRMRRTLEVNPRI